MNYKRKELKLYKVYCDHCKRMTPQMDATCTYTCQMCSQSNPLTCLHEGLWTREDAQNFRINRNNMNTSNLYQQDHWAVQTPDETKEVLAVFKHKEWAEEWRDTHSGTSNVVPVPDINYMVHVITAQIGDR